VSLKEGDPYVEDINRGKTKRLKGPSLQTAESTKKGTIRDLCQEKKKKLGKGPLFFAVETKKMKGRKETAWPGYQGGVLKRGKFFHVPSGNRGGNKGERARETFSQ